MHRKTLLVLILLLVGCGGTALPATATLPPAASAGQPLDLATANVPPTGQPPTQPAPTETPAPTAIPTTTPAPAVTPAPEDVFAALQAQALRPEFADDATLPDLPRYTMSIVADPAQGTFNGTQRIVYTNTTGAALRSLMLRSYVNFPPDVMGDGGDTFMNVTSASFDSTPLEMEVSAQNTAFRVILPQVLEPGATITIDTTFEGTLKAWDDGTWPFLSSYPMLALRDGPDGDWRTDVTRFPDHVFAESALYDVTVSLPADIAVFATGSAIDRNEGDVRTTTRFVSGPVREWAASFGRFESVSSEIDGITVTAYQAAGDDLDIERARDVAAAALHSFNSHFGAYPYRELDLHVMNRGMDAGIEYPGLTVILADGAINGRTDFVVEHEVAHQWWYGIVGNDIYRQPWLDESFANYTSLIASEERAGSATALNVYNNEMVRMYDQARQRGDPPAGLAITDYSSFNMYYWSIYGKGAVFLAELRGTMGDEAFFRGMYEYFQSQRYGISSRAAFQGTMETAADQSLEAFFDRWLGN